MLGKRVLTAILGTIFLIAIIYLGGWYYNFALLCVMLISLYEIYGALKSASFKPLAFIGYGFSILFFPVFMIKGIEGVFLLFILSSLLCMAFMLYGNNIRVKDVMSTVFSFIYPLSSLMLLVLMKVLPPEQVGIIALTITFVSSWATDTCAYFTGIKFGSRKLCPQISPKKTIEGAIGGLIGSSVISTLVGLFLYRYGFTGISWIHFCVLGVLCGVFSQVGDLTASIIKRQSGIKDFGYLFPGHGGLLDRFDSVLFVAPLVYFYFTWFLLP